VTAEKEIGRRGEIGFTMASLWWETAERGAFDAAFTGLAKCSGARDPIGCVITWQSLCSRLFSARYPRSLNTPLSLRRPSPGL
jgi:hypothetical protein